jgi:hypothetical protein
VTVWNPTREQIDALAELDWSQHRGGDLIWLKHDKRWTDTSTPPYE